MLWMVEMLRFFKYRKSSGPPAAAILLVNKGRLMTIRLHYGTTFLEVEVAADRLVANCTVPHASPLDDPAAAVAMALADPLGYPPLAQALVPGDRVALVVEESLPTPSAIVAGAVSALIAAKVAPENIVVVHQGRLPGDLLAELPDDLAATVEQQVHDPTDRDQLALLGYSRDSRPVYISRAIADADLVLPLVTLRAGGQQTELGMFDGLYPAFSNSETIVRLADSDHQRAEADELGWLLGVRLMLGVVPGAGGQALQVLAGDMDQLGPHGAKAFQAAWEYDIPQRADLVVVTLEGSSGEQTWGNVARALTAAERVVAEDGSVAICSGLAVEPGPAVQALSDPAVDRAAWGSELADGPIAERLAMALERGSVFLLSQLDEESVEDIGLAPVGSPQEMARLVERSGRCILLSNAQYARPLLSEAADP